MSKTPISQLLTPTQAADRLAIGRTRCYQLIRDGVIPSVRIGESPRVPAAKLDQYVERLLANQKPTRSRS